MTIVYVKIDGVLGFMWTVWTEGRAEVEWYIDGIKHLEVLEREEYILWNDVLKAEADGEDIL